jgi:hypothetical protein
MDAGSVCRTFPTSSGTNCFPSSIIELLQLSPLNKLIHLSRPGILYNGQQTSLTTVNLEQYKGRYRAIRSGTG